MTRAPFGRAAFEISDDEADIEAERRGFDARDGAPLPVATLKLLSPACYDAPP